MPAPLPDATECPCGAGGVLRACCGPYLRGETHPPTAEALMRSRYTAFVRGDVRHLWRTWHPRTRPDDVQVDPQVTWTGLDVLEVVAGGRDDDLGEVRFRATYVVGDRAGAHAEHSRFERRGGRWCYVDGDPADDPADDPVRRPGPGGGQG